MSKQVKHPHTGKIKMVLQVHDKAKYTVVYVSREAQYKSGAPYWYDDMFATIRQGGQRGILTQGSDYVVSRASFDGLRHFDTYEQAMAYIEALFALEN
jgi:hypothetical protein